MSTVTAADAHRMTSDDYRRHLDRAISEHLGICLRLDAARVGDFHATARELAAEMVRHADPTRLDAVHVAAAGFRQRPDPIVRRSEMCNVYIHAVAREVSEAVALIDSAR